MPKVRSDSSTLVEAIRLIPGYDPFADSEGFWFVDELAQRAIDFFAECLTHVKGKLAGQPFILEPWEQAIIANLFGWIDSEGLRRYREALIYVARKNGKTMLACGIVLLVMFTDHEPGAELYCGAADREQARLVFEPVAAMIRAEPELAKRATIYKKAITFDVEGSTFKPISRDANTKHGFNTHLGIIDELHAQQNAELVDVIETSMGARAQPLMVHITTADFARESVCNEKRDYAIQVRDGVIPNPRFLPVIYEASIDDDWHDREVWKKANPNLGVSVTWEYIEAKHDKAVALPRFENTFKRLHLNIVTEQDVRWLPMDLWDECGGAVPDLAGRECFAGLDLSSTTDLSSLVLAFPPEEDEPWCLLPFFWVPKDNAHRRELRDKVPYLVWAKDDHITLTPGNVIDYALIRKTVNELGEIYNIREIGVDRWSAVQLIVQLGGDGFDMVPFGQGSKSMSGPSKELEKLILAGQIRHGGHPVLRWNAANVTVETDAAENIKPSKKKSTERIDGVVAAVMAIGRAVEPHDDTTSVYESRDMIVLT